MFDIPKTMKKKKKITWWEIPHPGTLEKIKCATFKEAMDKWFEGFNIPMLVVDGVCEDFHKSYSRVRNDYKIQN